MNRVTITIPEELEWEVARDARRRGTSVSAVIRELLKERYAPPPDGKRVIPWAGIGDSGKGPHAAELDEFLKETWADAIDRDRR
ncbi:MAG: CopG family transcriptional regulator [Tepidiformaceae bacterium]